MPNVELLRKTLTHIEQHPKTWNQNVWRTSYGPCGTAYCFAGWAITLHGAKFAEDAYGLREEYVVPPGGDPRDSKQWRDISDYATDLLDLPPFENDGSWDGDLPPLFRAHNTLGDLRQMVAQLCDMEAAAT